MTTKELGFVELEWTCPRCKTRNPGTQTTCSGIDTGVHTHRLRDYDPTTGRYLQADPLGLVDGASVYGYVRQSPGRWTDARGESITFPLPRFIPRWGPIEIPRVNPYPGIGPLPIVPDFSEMAPVLPKDRTPEQAREAEREHERYRHYCHKQGPGKEPDPESDPFAWCQWASRALPHAEQCVEMIKTFDEKWTGGRHADNSIAQWTNRINRIKRGQAKYCSNLTCAGDYLPSYIYGVSN
jgi:RHS repeat-associated protein